MSQMFWHMLSGTIPQWNSKNVLISGSPVRMRSWVISLKSTTSLVCVWKFWDVHELYHKGAAVQELRPVWTRSLERHTNDDAFTCSAYLALPPILYSSVMSHSSYTGQQGELTELKGDHLKIRSPPEQKSPGCLRAFAQVMAPVLFLKEPGELQRLLCQAFTPYFSASSPIPFWGLFCNSATGRMQTTFSRFPCLLSCGEVLPMRDPVGSLEDGMRKRGSLLMHPVSVIIPQQWQRATAQASLSKPSISLVVPSWVSCHRPQP